MARERGGEMAVSVAVGLGGGDGCDGGVNDFGFWEAEEDEIYGFYFKK